MSGTKYTPTTSAITAPVKVISGSDVRTGSFSGNGVVLHLAQNDRQTVFAGIMENSILHNMVHSLTGSREKLLVQAVNNRTRERNYYHLYSRLLEKEISDEEFDAELETNPDKYVIYTDKIPSDEEFHDAIALSDFIMDTETTGDIESLFSFDGRNFNEKCKKLMNGTL